MLYFMFFIYHFISLLFLAIQYILFPVCYHVHVVGFVFYAPPGSKSTQISCGEPSSVP